MHFKEDGAEDKEKNNMQAILCVTCTVIQELGDGGRDNN